MIFVTGVAVVVWPHSFVLVNSKPKKPLVLHNIVVRTGIIAFTTAISRMVESRRSGTVR